MARTPKRRLNVGGKLLFWGFRAIWTMLVILIPLTGVWVGSSLAAYGNGPIWVAFVAGLLLFPGLPLVWEGWSRRRKGRRLLGKRRVGTLTTWDRIVLRTLSINLVLLGGLLWAAPSTVFTALSSRGDWMLDPVEHPVADDIRPWLFGAADGMQWLYDAANSNEYEELIEEDARPAEEPTPAPHEDPAPPPAPAPEAAETASAGPEPPPTRPAPAPATRRPWHWPQEAALHPAVTAMPPAYKADVESVGQYLLAQEPDPYRRVKAIHDFVADHVAYDGPSYVSGAYPPQDASTVLRRGVGVCAGYANLIKAIADVTGDEVVVVVGDARTRGGDISGEGHAWNAAKIEQRWYLIDATWDAGHLDGSTFVKEFSTDYLFVPPTVMGATHFPDDRSWQLRPEPISRGEFFRQPILSPRFHADGFVLQYPTRSQVTVKQDFELRLGNPTGKFVLARFSDNPDVKGERCKIANGKTVRVTCPLPGSGTYHVTLFGSAVEYGSYHYLGEIEVNARG